MPVHRKTKSVTGAGYDSNGALYPYSTVQSKKELPRVKKRVKQIAIELCYPTSAILAIDKAKSEAEIDQIMVSARKGEYDESISETTSF